MKEHLTKWEQATDTLSKLFIRHYFGKNTESFWVADEIGGVLAVNDYFFSLDHIVDFIRYRYSKKMMFEYYDYALKVWETGQRPINIKTYRKTK